MLAEAFDRQVAERGDAPFLVEDGTAVSWNDSAARVWKLASWLTRVGVAPGDRVAMLLPNGLPFFLILLAINRAGAIAVPLHTGSVAGTTLAILSEVEPKLCIAHSTLWSADARAAVGDSIVIDSLDDLDLLIAAETSAPPMTRADGDPSFFMYTSGTTGRPKGVVIPEAAFPSAGAELAGAIALDRDDRIALALPLFHTNPVVYGLMAAVSTGCSLAILPRFDARTFLAEAAALGATGFTYVGTILSLIALRGTPPAASPIRFCVGGGAPVAAWKTLEQWDIEVLELYGMTETGGWVTGSRRGAARQGYCGTARPGLELAIVDPDDVPVTSGEVGQIVTRPRSPHLQFTEYFRRPEITLEKFSNLWFHTGDRGSLTADGFLAFADRLDSLIRRGGENVDPVDVTEVLESYPGIGAAHVVGVPDAVMGQELRAVVIVERDIEYEDLARHCAAHLPRNAWPRYLAVVEQFPITATQKVDLAALREQPPTDVDLRPVYPKGRAS